MAKRLPDPKDWEYVRVGSSRLHGRGLFAACDLAKGQNVMEYRGARVGKREGTRLTELQTARGRLYVFNLNKRVDLDGSVMWNRARLANHSCEPNCESQSEAGRRIWIVAMRSIKAGDEITYDYHFDFMVPPPPCLCGAKRCRGYIVGPKERGNLVAWLKQESLPIPVPLLPRPRQAQRSSRASR